MNIKVETPLKYLPEKSALKLFRHILFLCHFRLSCNPVDSLKQIIRPKPHCFYFDGFVVHHERKPTLHKSLNVI